MNAIEVIIEFVNSHNTKSNVSDFPSLQFQSPWERDDGKTDLNAKFNESH